MENNINETVDTTQQNPTSIDYKAEYEKLVSERDNFKALKDKYSKESAEWKNKYTSTLSDVELAKNQQEERDAYTKSLEEKVARIELGAELSKGIKDEKVLNGVIDDLIGDKKIDAIKKINKYIETRVADAIKEHDAELLRSNPVPPPTTATGGITKEQFDAMSVAERSELFVKDRETYNKLVNQ
jgi:hypothetical protein